jgi:hypothetical protein
LLADILPRECLLSEKKGTSLFATRLGALDLLGRRKKQKAKT